MQDNRIKTIDKALSEVKRPNTARKIYLSYLKRKIISDLVEQELPKTIVALNFCISGLVISAMSLVIYQSTYSCISTKLAAFGSGMLFLTALLCIVVDDKRREIKRDCMGMIQEKMGKQWL